MVSFRTADDQLFIRMSHIHRLLLLFFFNSNELKIHTQNVYKIANRTKQGRLYIVYAIDYARHVIAYVKAYTIHGH